MANMIRVFLNQTISDELRNAVAECNTNLEEGDEPLTPEQFVSECVQSNLASRRADRFENSRLNGTL